MIGQNIGPSAEGIDINYGVDISVNPLTSLLEPEEPPMIFGTCPGRSNVDAGPGPVLPKSDARLTSPVDCARNTLLNEFTLTEGSKEMRRFCSVQLSQMWWQLYRVASLQKHFQNIRIDVGCSLYLYFREGSGSGSSVGFSIMLVLLFT